MRTGATTLLLVAACAGGDLGVDDLCDELTRVMCEGNVACCNQETRSYATIEACMEDNLRLCEAIIADNVRAGGLTYDAAGARAFADEVADSASSCARLPDLGVEHHVRGDRTAPRVGLAGFISPTLPDGAPCGVEGAPANACVDTCVLDEPMGLGGASGICGPEPRGSAGEACDAAFGSVRCETTLVCIACDVSPGTCDPEPSIQGGGFCAPPGEMGEACSFGACREGLHCDAPSPLDPGVCAAPKPDGEPCTSHTECTAGFCDVGDDASAPRCGAEPAARTHCPVWVRRIG